MWGHSTCSLIGLALDEQKQELYAADGGNSHIVVFSTVTGKVVRVLGSGGTGDGQFHMPYGLALDGLGNRAAARAQYELILLLSPTSEVGNIARGILLEYDEKVSDSVEGCW